MRLRTVCGVVVCCLVWCGAARAQVYGPNALHNELVRRSVERHELQRQVSERQTVLMHRGVIPRPEGFTIDDLTAKYAVNEMERSDAAARYRRSEERRVGKECA